MSIDHDALLLNARRAEWTTDEYGTLWLRILDAKGHPVSVFIERRNHYCDRGHWKANVEYGVPGLDSADSFPRYFMRLEVAKQEMKEWLLWRLFKVRAEPFTAALNPIEHLLGGNP